MWWARIPEAIYVRAMYFYIRHIEKKWHCFGALIGAFSESSPELSFEENKYKVANQ